MIQPQRGNFHSVLCNQVGSSCGVCHFARRTYGGYQDVSYVKCDVKGSARSELQSASALEPGVTSF